MTSSYSKLTEKENFSIKTQSQESIDTIKELSSIKQCYINNINRFLEMKNLTKTRIFLKNQKEKEENKENNCLFNKVNCIESIDSNMKGVNVLKSNKNTEKIEEKEEKTMENQEKTMDFIRKSLLSRHKHHSDYEIKSLNQRTILKDKIESLSILPINKTTFSFKNLQYNSYNTHINELYIRINKVFLKKLMIYFIILRKSIYDNQNKNFNLNDNNSDDYSPNHDISFKDKGKDEEQLSLSCKSESEKTDQSNLIENQRISYEFKYFLKKIKKITKEKEKNHEKTRKNHEKFRVFIRKSLLNRLSQYNLLIKSIKSQESLIKSIKNKEIEKIFDFFKENTNINKVKAYYKYKLKKKSLKNLILYKKTSENLTKQSVCLKHYFAYKNIFNKLKIISLTSKNHEYNHIILKEFLRIRLKRKGFQLIKQIFIEETKNQKRKLEYYSSYISKYDKEGENNKKYINLKVKKTETVLKSTVSEGEKDGMNGIRRVLKEEISIIKNKKC